jgi:hypothetical protein
MTSLSAIISTWWRHRPYAYYILRMTGWISIKFSTDIVVLEATPDSSLSISYNQQYQHDGCSNVWGGRKTEGVPSQWRYYPWFTAGVPNDVITRTHTTPEWLDQFEWNLIRTLYHWRVLQKRLSATVLLIREALTNSSIIAPLKRL